MDMNRLHYFTVIVDSGSLSRASEILHISQPALSKAMKVLESELGLQLFTPNGRNLSLTDEALRLFPKIRKLLQDAEVLLSKSEEIFQDKIRLGTFEVFSTHFFGRLVKNYFPEIEIELHELRPGQLEAALIRGDIDYAITYIPIPHPDLDFHEITKTKMVICGRKVFFKDKDFNELDFVIPIMPVTGSPTKMNGLDGWPDEKILRKIKYKVSMMESALELCRQGKACAYIPQFILQMHNETVKDSLELVEYPYPLKKLGNPQAVYVVKRKSTTETSKHKKLAKALRQLI